ncbi:hypothetical protein GGR58DRAFT_308921 [Xylaria digitata]|nr:hypothetical protein GGR58DRAFT_308921 [Xylaria digitata]
MEMEGRSQQELIEMLEARAPEDWKYVQNLGEMKSTIMHVLSDRWDERLSTFFQALMEQFPEMYLAEDYLNHTILDRNQSGRSRDLFACFFTENYQVEAAELVKRHPNLLALLLSALKDSDIWTRILREIPSDTLLANDSKSGNTFLHSVIQKAYRPRERDSRRFLTLIKEITQVNPKTMRATNAMGLTPYLYNVFEAKKQLELKESFSKRLVVWLRDRQRGDKPEESLSKRQVALLHDRQRDEVVMKSTEETAYPDKAQNHSATRKKQISTLLLRQMYRHLDVGHVRDILEGDEEDEGKHAFDLSRFPLDFD